jgi:hypothetical protein
LFFFDTWASQVLLNLQVVECLHHTLRLVFTHELRTDSSFNNFKESIKIL